MKFTIIFKNSKNIYLWGGIHSTIDSVLTRYCVINNIENVQHFLDTIDCYLEEHR